MKSIGVLKNIGIACGLALPVALLGTAIGVGASYGVKASKVNDELNRNYYHSERVENYIESVKENIISSVDNDTEDNSQYFNYKDLDYLKTEEAYEDLANTMYRNDKNYQALIKQRDFNESVALWQILPGVIGLFGTVFIVPFYMIDIIAENSFNKSKKQLIPLIKKLGFSDEDIEFLGRFQLWDIETNQEKLNALADKGVLLPTAVHLKLFFELQCKMNVDDNLYKEISQLTKDDCVVLIKFLLGLEGEDNIKQLPDLALTKCILARGKEETAMADNADVEYIVTASNNSYDVSVKAKDIETANE